MVLMDLIWGAFEKTGDVRYYLEYKDYEAVAGEVREDEAGGKMDRTG